MKRIVFNISLATLLWLTACSEAPKTNEMAATKEDVVTAKVNEPKEDPSPEILSTIPTTPSETKEISSEPKKKLTAVKPKKKEEKPTAIKEAAPKPKPVKTFSNITFEKTVHEFGEIDEGDQITHKFKFKNTGNGPLTIDNVDVSCGCTMPTYPIIPIGPGETGEIGVVYNSKGKFGTQKPSITVKTNATQPIVKLYMSGSIKHVFEKPSVDSTETKG